MHFKINGAYTSMFKTPHVYKKQLISIGVKLSMLILLYELGPD
jgi:hypothetical protein